VLRSHNTAHLLLPIRRPRPNSARDGKHTRLCSSACAETLHGRDLASALMRSCVHNRTRDRGGKPIRLACRGHCVRSFRKLDERATAVANSAELYRQFARDCLRLAHAVSGEARTKLIEMAAEWDRLADQQDHPNDLWWEPQQSVQPQPAQQQQQVQSKKDDKKE
jgi:hypothetical protein